MNVRLSNSVADKAKSTGKRYVIYDTEIPAFGLRIEKSGTRSWIISYRPGGGGRKAPVKLKVLGRYPVISAPAARSLAKDLLADVRKGGDPASLMAARRSELTVAEAIDFYEKEGCIVQRGIRQGEPMKPLTKQYTLARLRNHVVPLIGKRRVTDIEEGDIQSLARDITRGKTERDERAGFRKRVIVKGGDGAARKVVRDVSALYSFLLTHKKKTGVTANPVEHAAVRKTDNKRTRFLSIEEVKRLGAALDMLEADGANIKAVNIARGWALTGCRRNEIAGIKKSEIDIARGVLVFDDTKTGRSVRPIAGAAVALFEALLKRSMEEFCKSEFLFPAERGESFYQGTRAVWAEAIKRAKLPGVTAHTLRHTLGGLGGSTGESLLMIGALLGHSNARSTSIYAHIDREPARLAADRVAGPIAQALGVAATGPKSEVPKYIQAIVEPVGSTFSIYFPSLPGCGSAADTFDQIIPMAQQALSVHLAYVPMPEPMSAEQAAQIAADEAEPGSIVMTIPIPQIAEQAPETPTHVRKKRSRRAPLPNQTSMFDDAQTDK